MVGAEYDIEGKGVLRTIITTNYDPQGLGFCRHCLDCGEGGVAKP